MLRVLDTQQSVYQYVIWKVTSPEVLLCRGTNTVEEFAKADVKQSCPLDTNTALVAVADDLPVAGVDFLLDNYPSCGRVWMPTPTSCAPTSCGASEEPEKVVADSIWIVTRFQTRGVKESAATPGADCRATADGEQRKAYYYYSWWPTAPERGYRRRRLVLLN